jgi:hypothetical protein
MNIFNIIQRQPKNEKNFSLFSADNFHIPIKSHFVRLGFYEAEVVSKKLVVKLITEFLSYTF